MSREAPFIHIHGTASWENRVLIGRSRRFAYFYYFDEAFIATTLDSAIKGQNRTGHGSGEGVLLPRHFLTVLTFFFHLKRSTGDFRGSVAPYHAGAEARF